MHAGLLCISNHGNKGLSGFNVDYSNPFMGHANWSIVDYCRRLAIGMVGFAAAWAQKINVGTTFLLSILFNHHRAEQFGYGPAEGALSLASCRSFK